MEKQNFLVKQKTLLNILKKIKRRVEDKFKETCEIEIKPGELIHIYLYDFDFYKDKAFKKYKETARKILNQKTDLPVIFVCCSKKPIEKDNTIVL